MGCDNATHRERSSLLIAEAVQVWLEFQLVFTPEHERLVIDAGQCPGGSLAEGRVVEVGGAEYVDLPRVLHTLQIPQELKCIFDISRVVVRLCYRPTLNDNSRECPPCFHVSARFCNRVNGQCLDAGLPQPHTKRDDGTILDNQDLLLRCGH